MNVETGKIFYSKKEEADEIMKKMIEKGEAIPIEEKDMTEKQKETLQVSKYDSVSKLGKLFKGNRAERRKMAKMFRNQNVKKK